MSEQAAGEIELATVYYNVEARFESLKQVAPTVEAAERAVAGASGNTAASLARTEQQATKTAGAFTKEAVAAEGAASAQQILAKSSTATALAQTETAGASAVVDQALRKQTVSSGEAHKGLRKVESGLVAIAVSATGTAGPVGTLITGLLTFGAGSAAVLGVAAALAVLSKGYELATAESRKQEEQDKKTRDAIQGVRDAAKTPVQVANDLLTGAVNAKADALDNLRKAQENYNLAVSQSAAINNPTLIGLAQGPLNDAVAALAQANKDLETAKQNRTSVGRESRAQELQDLIEARGLHLQINDGVAREADLVKQLRAIEADTTKPLKDRIEARKTLNDLAAAERDRARELRDIVFAGRDAAAQMTKDLTDNAIVALERFDAQAKATVDALPAGDRAVAQRSLDRQRLLVQENVRAARALDAAGPAVSFNDFDRIDAAINKLIEAEQQLVVGGQAYEAVEKRIGELEERKTQLMQNELNYSKAIAAQEAQNENKSKAAAERARHSLDEQVKLIDSAIRGALTLAQAFGLVGDETAKTLGDILSLADTLPALSKSISQLRAGKGSAAEVVSAALPVVGAVASIVSGFFGGNDAEEKARREALQHNTAAIDKLASTIGELGLAGVSGSQFAAAERAVASFDSQNFAGHGGPGDTFNAFDVSDAERSALEAKLKADGTSLRQLQDLADSLGLTVNFMSDSAAEVRDAFEKLGEAMKETEIARFAETFGGQLDALRLQAELFNKSATQQLEDLQHLQNAVDEHGDPLGSPAIAKALQGLDLNTAEGRAAALANLQQLSLLLNQDNGLNSTDLGGLNGDQFAQALRDLKALLDQANQEGGSGASTSFSQTRSITEEQFDRQFGIMVTQSVYLSLITTSVQAIEGMIANYTLPNIGVQPPPLAAPGEAQGSGVSLTGGIHVTVIVGAVSDAAAATGDAVAEAVLSRLGSAIRSGRAAAGQVGVT